MTPPPHNFAGRRSLTVRARITLWNVGVMAFVLVILGVALRYTVQAYLITTIDRELTGRYERNREGWSRITPPRDLFVRGGRNERVGGPGGDGRRGERGGSGERGTGTERGEESGVAPPTVPLVAASVSATQPSARPSPMPSPSPTPSPSPGPPSGRGRIFGTDGEPYFYGPDRFDRSGRDQRLLDRAGFERASRGQLTASTIELDGAPLRVLSGPLRSEDDLVVAVSQHSFALADIHRGVGAVTLILLVLIPLALLAAGIGGAFLTERALRPVREITDAAGLIEAEDLSGRLPVQGDDEFARLAATFNAMLERIESAFNRQRRFTADASHELRTPLSVIKASTSLALESPRDAAQYRAILETIDPAADRMERIVRDLLFLARSDGKNLPVERQPILLRHLLEDAVREIRPYGTGGAPVAVATADPDLVVEGDPHHLNRLLVNLIENADRHTPAAGRITVSARASGEGVEVAVADTGEGIGAEHLPHVFEQFYRVDPARSREAGGAGLGLAICKAIVEAHGGTIGIASEVGGGTTVTVRLPGRVAAPAAAAAAGGSATVA